MEQKQKYVYVDYENMGNIKELVPINGKYFFFIGSNQKTVPSSLVVATNGMSVEWIIIEGTGKNALDFHIAYYLGVKSSEENIIHYILSKDKGYDPLITSINKKSHKDIAKRIISLDDLKDKKPHEDKIESQIYDRVMSHFNNIQKNKRPKSEKSLKNTIKTQILKNLGDKEVDKIIDELYRKSYISKGANNHVTYNNAGCSK